MNTARRPVYSTCGLTMRSEIELHLPVVDDPTWDVDVTWGPDLDSAEEPLQGEAIAVDTAWNIGWYAVTATPAAYRLRFRDCGEFVITSDLSRVLVRREVGGRTHLLPVLLSGTVTALLLALAGRTVLHASAVTIGDRALAVVAQSGRGKSTLAALLCADGAALLADDVLTVEPTAPVSCHGGAGELRLRDAAATIAAGQAAGTTRSTADERLAWGPGRRSPTGPIELGAIVFPVPSREHAEVDIRPVAPSEALFALLACPRIHGWKSLDVVNRDFATLSAVADAVPAYVAVIPWGPPFSPSIAPALAALVADGGPTADGVDSV